MTFAATHAEAIFLPGMIPEKTKVVVDNIKSILTSQNRSPESVKFIAGIFVCVAETDSAAQAKWKELLTYADLEGTAALFGGWTGTDLSKFDDDADFSFSGPPAIQGLINTWTQIVPGTKDVKWTKRRVLQELAINGAHGRAVGGPETVADIMETWVREAGVNGFNLSYATTPGTFEDLIKYLWPELKKRGVLQEEYAGQTMREAYLQDEKGPRVREGHPAKEFAWKR